MKNLLLTLVHYCCITVVFAQTDTMHCGSATVVFQDAENTLLCYTQEGKQHLLANDVIYSGDFNFYVDKTDSTITILGHDINEGSGCLPLVAKFIQYKLEVNKIRILKTFYYPYCHSSFTSFRLKYTERAYLQLWQENKIILSKPLKTLNETELKALLDPLTIRDR